jgi:riboflavin synthase
VFTGLIETTGRLTEVRRHGDEARLWIAPRETFSGLRHGESISVNGVCLTAEAFSGTGFAAYASQETLGATTLGGLQNGDEVNLERALAVGDRMGGHFVSGHVDCLGAVETVKSIGESRRVRVAFPASWSALVVDKGSVAVDGISLTVTRCGKGFLEVNLIPATYAHTTAATWARSRRVNLEFDIIGKYVQRMLGAWSGDGEEGGISWDFLQRHGFQ